MNAGGRAIESLRALHRGYKLALVLLAAWAPMLLTRNPWFAIGIMSGCTAAFFLATRTQIADLAGPLPSPSAEKGVDDVQP